MRNRYRLASDGGFGREGFALGAETVDGVILVELVQRLRLIVQNRVVVHDEVLAHKGGRVTGFSHVCI